MSPRANKRKRMDGTSTNPNTSMNINANAGKITVTNENDKNVTTNGGTKHVKMSSVSQEVSDNVAAIVAAEAATAANSKGKGK